VSVLCIFVVFLLVAEVELEDEEETFSEDVFFEVDVLDKVLEIDEESKSFVVD